MLCRCLQNRQVLIKPLAERINLIARLVNMEDRDACILPLFALFADWRNFRSDNRNIAKGDC